MVTDDGLTGGDLDKMTDEELAERLESATLCAKVSPAQKARIIEALHLRDHVVGFLGDGINDGPALKSADVGISVDTAVDIAKESADIILLEKSLIVLSEGVLEGRKIFGNIVKYIKMGASSNFGNMLSVLGASIFLPFLPMAPIQVLTNNLLYDFSQTTIPTDNVDDEYIAAPRRWDIGNITKFMLCLGPISSIFDYVTYGMLLSLFAAWSNPPLFQTGWFVESLLTQKSSDADLDHPHYPHRKDPVFAEPCEQRADRDDDSRGRRWGSPTLFPIGAHTRFRAASGRLLAGGVDDYSRLLRAGAFGQELVRAPLGALRRRARGACPESIGCQMCQLSVPASPAGTATFCRLSQWFHVRIFPKEHS